MSELSLLQHLTPELGTWVLVLIAFITLVKLWPVILKMTHDAKHALRQEGRDDLRSCRERIDEMQGQIDGLREAVHNVEMKLLGAISAYKILDADVERRDPESEALIQARAVISAAFTLSPSTAAPWEPKQ